MAKGAVEPTAEAVIATPATGHGRGRRPVITAASSAKLGKLMWLMWRWPRPLLERCSWADLEGPQIYVFICLRSVPKTQSAQ